MHSQQLSLAGGAVRGWDRRNAYYYPLICSLAEHYGFDPEQPFEKLPQAIKDVIFYGSGKEDIAFKQMNANGGYAIRFHPFEGVVNIMERRYRETDSSLVREELAKYMGSKPCPDCGGTRLNKGARHVFVTERNLPTLTALPIRQALGFFDNLQLPGQRGEVAAKIVKEIRERLQFLVNVGLDYLTLDRSAETLSGGEAQRIRLASQVGAGLVGVMYVLDEPSIGLHQRDNERLLKTLIHLRDLGNTVIVVEHDEDAIMTADHVVDIGPGAGVHGGCIVAEGTPKQIKEHPDSLTGQYLSGRLEIEIPVRRNHNDAGKVLRLVNATGNNLKGVDAAFPVISLVPDTSPSACFIATIIAPK